MKYNKHIAAAAGLVLVSVLTGCSDTGFQKYEKLLNKKSPAVITIWHYYNGVQQTHFDEMISKFNNTVGMEKGIIVEAFSKNSVKELSDSIVASVNNDAGADDIPDIFGTYAETAYTVDRLGMLADMSKYFTADELGEYVDQYISEGTFSNGSLKIFPIAKSTEVLMLNKTAWDKFAEAEGVDLDSFSTWESLAETAEKYYNYTDALTPDVPNDGHALFGRDSVANYMIIGAKQLGNEFIRPNADGTVNVVSDKATVRKIWDNYYVPFVKGYYAAENRFRSDDMKTGEIISMVCSNSAASYCPTEVTLYDDYTYPIEVSVLPVPNFEGCDPYIVQQGAGMSVIKSDKKTEYACAVFLKWFTSEEQNIEFAVNSGYLPVKRSANDINKILSSGTEISPVLRDTFEVAINEIGSYTFYTSVPFEYSADVRAYIESSFEDAYTAARAEAYDRIAAGWDRDVVMNKYTDDAAFESWYAGFSEGLNQIIGK